MPEPVPAPETVTHALVVEAAHVHPACVVTTIVPDAPVVGAVIPEGVRVNIHAPLACVTVNVFPAMVKVADLANALVFAAAVYVTVPDPVPDAPLEMTTHPAPLDAVQLQSAAVVTATVAAPPPAAID